MVRIRGGSSGSAHRSLSAVAGPDPAIAAGTSPENCATDRGYGGFGDGRVKPGHDGEEGVASNNLRGGGSRHLLSGMMSGVTSLAPRADRAFAIPHTHGRVVGGGTPDLDPVRVDQMARHPAIRRAGDHEDIVRAAIAIGVDQR